MKMRVGDWVVVRSKEEILSTLDKRGRMEGLPFMPQMFQYCGQRFQVFKSAHKTCDWVYTVKSRWLPGGIHLDLRCDGAAYGGCQAGCLIYWKDAWLRRVDQTGDQREESAGDGSVSRGALETGAHCTEADVVAGTRGSGPNEDSEPIYNCQGTELPDFTQPIRRWNISQYLQDYGSGNVTLGRLGRGAVYAGFWRVHNAGIGLGRPLRWLYDVFQFIWGPYPKRPGKILPGQPTPTSSLNLQAGELVRVKAYEEILATLDKSRKNRGLAFDAEMVPYCGSVHAVRTRMTRFIDEKTRKLVTMKNACILLEHVWCQSRYSDCRMFCPRSIYSWWHEIWLERVSESTQAIPKTHKE